MTDDKWERLKEFIEKERENKHPLSIWDTWAYGELYGLVVILAEIERLEKERT